jgi:hypothetical protein
VRGFFGHGNFSRDQEYLKRALLVAADVPKGVVTYRLTRVPEAIPGGAVTVIRVALFTV